MSRIIDTSIGASFQTFVLQVPRGMAFRDFDVFPDYAALIRATKNCHFDRREKSALWGLMGAVIS